ncbi:MAG: hypothetical protein WCO89_08790 [Syntrophus sp. (in: bacteria)]
MKEKTIDEILKEEFLKERAVVLGRTGESVAKAIAKLQHMAQVIEENHQHIRSLEDRLCGDPSHNELRKVKEKALKDINKMILQYNRLWDHAQLRYYYLIVTREAMGLRSLHRVEEFYLIPPKKKQLPGG